MARRISIATAWALPLTWYGNNGYYLDVLGKWTHYDTELAADSVNGGRMAMAAC